MLPDPVTLSQDLLLLLQPSQVHAEAWAPLGLLASCHYQYCEHGHGVCPQGSETNLRGSGRVPGDKSKILQAQEEEILKGLWSVESPLPFHSLTPAAIFTINQGRVAQGRSGDWAPTHGFTAQNLGQACKLPHLQTGQCYHLYRMEPTSVHWVVVPPSMAVRTTR